MHWWKWIWNEDFFSLSVLLVLLHWRLYLRYPREILSIIVTRRSTSVAHITMTCIFITLFYFQYYLVYYYLLLQQHYLHYHPPYNNCLRWLIHILPRHLLSLQTYLPSSFRPHIVGNTKFHVIINTTTINDNLLVEISDTKL